MAQSISQEAVVNTGLPGATAASRYAGATTSGAPTTGTFAVGDYVVDQTGAMYVCTVAGTPGTWQLSGVSVNENIAGKNFVINGGMDIAQRGTSVSVGATTLTYTLDRWCSYTTSPTVTVSQIGIGNFAGTSTATSSTSLTMSSATWSVNAYAGCVVTAGSSTATVVSNTATVLTVASWTGGTPSTGLFSIAGLTGFQYAIRTQRNSGQGAGTIYQSQSLETKNSIPLAGQTVTVSFWARDGANYSQTGNGLFVALGWNTTTDGNILNGGFTQPISTTQTITTSWVRYSYTTTIPSNATQVGFYVTETAVGTAGANDYFDITGVQLEIAPQATPFSRAGGSIGGELALCQRYYWQVGVGVLGPAVAISTSNLYGYVYTPVSMRLSPPTATAYQLVIQNAGFTGYSSVTTASSLSISNGSSNIVGINYTSNVTSYSVGSNNWISNNGGSSYLSLSAEL